MAITSENKVRRLCKCGELLLPNSPNQALCEVCQKNQYNHDYYVRMHYVHRQHQPKNCKKCGVFFTPKGNFQKYCDSCRTIRAKAKKMGCLNCGKELTNKKHWRFCSESCWLQFDLTHTNKKIEVAKA